MAKYDFHSALKFVLQEQKVRRKDWPDARSYMALDDKGRLVIFNPEDSMTHPLILRDVDIKATDWMLCRKEIKDDQ